MINITDSTCYAVIKDIITLVITIYGLYITSSGIDVWRKQLRGSKNFETAYNLHYSILKLREAINYVRNPGIWPSEKGNAIKYAKEKEPEKTISEIKEFEHEYVYEMRWEKIKSALIEVELHRLSAEVLWGRSVVDIIKPLADKTNELAHNLKLNFSRYSVNKSTEEYLRIDEVIYNSGENNKFTKELNESIQNVVNYIEERSGAIKISL